MSITEPSQQVSISIWFLQAFMLSLPTMAFAWLISFLPLRPGYIPYFRRPFFSYLIAIPLLWVFFHWGLSIARPLTSVWKFAPILPLPTDVLVYSQYGFLPILQLLKYIGPAGLEFLLILVNSAIAALIIELVKTKEGPVERVDAISPKAGALFDLLVAAIIVGLLYCFGQSKIDDSIRQSKEFLQYDKNNELTQPILPVGVIANDKFSLVSDVSSIEKRLAIIVFPETGNDINLGQMNNILNVVQNAAKQNRNIALLSFTSGKRQNIDRQNLILSLNNSINIKQSINIDNQKPVFLSASLPTFFQEWLFSPDKDDSSSWYSLAVPKTIWGKVGLLSGANIADFRLAANEVRRGASLIVSSTNLSWIKSRFLSKQLLAAAIFRAIENNRYVILCADGQVLAVIEPNGLVQSLFFQPSVLEHKEENKDSHLLLGRVQFLWSKTPFTKTWWL